MYLRLGGLKVYFSGCDLALNRAEEERMESSEVELRAEV